MMINMIRSDPEHVQLLEVIGRVDNANIPHLVSSMRSAMDNGQTRLILDMNGVTYLNSAGLRVLVQMYKRIQHLGGSLYIANPSAPVRRLFDLVGLDTIFNIEYEPALDLAHISATTLPAPQRQVCYFS